MLHMGLERGKDWTRVRRDLTDEQISRIYLLYEALWPLETDLLQLLPKPDGIARAVYTGHIHPATITDFALGASLYFGELLVEHPFVHAGTVKKEFSPVENPRAYRQEFLKTVLFFLTVMPLVEAGLVNLIPDPCNFDFRLRKTDVSYGGVSVGGHRKTPTQRCAHGRADEAGLPEMCHVATTRRIALPTTASLARTGRGDS